MPPRRPNIVLVVADDLGSTDLGCYGAADLRTPNLDALAGRGVRLTDFHVTAPACTASRASLLTGREHARCLQRGLGLEADEVTLAELLRGAGYRTGIFGKWHLGIPPAVSPRAQGFDAFLGFKNGAIDNFSHYDYWGPTPAHVLWRDDGAWRADGEYFPELITREAVAWVRAQGGDPFFLYLPYNLPHYPLQSPVASLRACAHIADPARRLYAASLHALDDGVGRVLQAVDAAGLTRDTVVVFLGDHGHSAEAPAEGGGGRAGPFRGHKGTMWEGGIRVPCLAAWPGHWPAGAVRAQLTSSMDWVPTLAACAGVAVDGLTLDGARLDEVLASPTAPGHPWLSWIFESLWAVREGQWKMLGEGPDIGFLGDLAADPGEATDLRGRRKDVVRRLVDVRNAWAHGLRTDPTVIRELGL